MMFAVATVLALVAVADGRTVNLEASLKDFTAYDYHSKIGLPLAEKIRKAEEENSLSRIAGGSAAQLGQLPYQAGLVITFSFGHSICGGTLINNRRVLTAAHCWFDGVNQAWLFTVVLGSITAFHGGTRLDTANVIMHSAWNPSLIRNDIAVIYLPSSVATTANIAPIALPSANELNENFAGLTGTVSGFGITGDGGTITATQFLSYVNQPIITNEECAVSYPFIQTSNLCTSGAGGRNPCTSDSGGPLAVTFNGRRVLVGVVSFGSARGCEQGFPAAFARVTSFMDFINSNFN